MSHKQNDIFEEAKYEAEQSLLEFFQGEIEPANQELAQLLYEDGTPDRAYDLIVDDGVGNPIYDSDGSPAPRPMSPEEFYTSLHEGGEE